MRARRRASAALLLAAAFGLGWAGGRASSRSHGPPPGPPPNLTLTRADLIDGLDPEPEQRREMERILARGQARTDSVGRRLLVEMREVTSDIERDLRSLLTPEQELRLDSILAAPGNPMVPRVPGPGR